MNTQPTNEFLNHERLTDLAQFAVPDGHDLWPRIEHAARMSATSMTTPRPGTLSLGLSRAWTAVGVLLIAATFAALGFGLAVLVLSNGHGQVPAAPVTPTPITSTASQVPAVTGGTQTNQGGTAVTDASDSLQALLTGDTLARYRALPEEYQVALGAYRTFGVSDDLIPAIVAEKMAQWPGDPEPIRDLLNVDRYSKFQELTAIHPQLGDAIRINRYAFFFLSYYPYVVQTENTTEGRQGAFALLLDAIAHEFSPGDIPQVPEPQLDDLLVPSALAMLNELGPRLQEAMRTRSSTDTVDVQTLAINVLTLETMLLKTEPGLEIPALLEYLSAEDEEIFMALPEDVREEADRRYVKSVLFRMKGLATSPDHPATSLPDEDILTEIAKQEFEFARQLAARQSIPSQETAHAKMQTILSGETLDRYRALPPAYQEALGLYTWHDLPPDVVRSAVKDKIDQWGDAVIPLPELLGEDRAGRFERLEGEIYNHAYLLVSYYVLVLNTESSDKGRAEAMQQYIDYIAPRPPNTSTTEPEETRFSSAQRAPMVAWPPLESVLTKTALAQLDTLGPRLREQAMNGGPSSSGESDIQNVATFLTLYELFFLKAQSGLEMPSLEETLTGDDLATFKNFSEADRDSAESFFQRGLFSLHYVGAAGLPPNSTIPKPTPDILAKEASFAMEWVILSAKSENDQKSSAESWVSENGFIQFTTGALEDLFDEPLPGTHPQCIPPTTPPEQPGPWLVPTKLPDGMEQEVRDQMFPGTMYRAFRRPMDHVSMEQGLCAIRQLNPLTYRAIQIGDRTAYVTARGKLSADGSARVFDPNAASTLIMDVGYGVVSFNVFGSVTADELVDMAASLAPEELTDAEKGPYPQAVLDELGTGFGPVYVPSKLPDGYEMFGQMQARQEALGPRTARLSYVRTSDNYCVFRLNQAGLRRQFPDVVQKAQRGDETSYTTTDESGQTVRATAKWGTVEIDGVTIYAQEFSAQPRNEYTDVYFQSQGVWFNLTISTSSYCDHSLKMVAEIAASLEPL